MPFTPPPTNLPPGSGSGYTASTNRTTNYQTNGAYDGAAGVDGTNNPPKKLADNLGGKDTGNSRNSGKGGGRSYGRPKNQRGKSQTSGTRSGSPSIGWRKGQQAIVSGTGAVGVHSTHNTWDFDFGYTGSTGTTGTTSSSHWWDGILSTAQDVATHVNGFNEGVRDYVANTSYRVGPVTIAVYAVVAVAFVVVLALA